MDVLVSDSFQMTISALLAKVLFGQRISSRPGYTRVDPHVTLHGVEKHPLHLGRILKDANCLSYLLSATLFTPGQYH